MGKKIKDYLVHYLYGLAVSCWRAGILAIKLSGGVASGAALAPGHVPAPNLIFVCSLFGSACFWAAVDYFANNQPPATLREILAPKSAPAASAAPTSVPATPS